MDRQTSKQDIGKIPIKGSEKKNPENFQDIPVTVVVKLGKPVCMQVQRKKQINLNEKSQDP